MISVTIGASIAAFLFALIGAVRQEPDQKVEAAEKARSQSFIQTLKEVVIPDPQVRLFFLIVVLTFIGTLAQDDFLEPYGALVLNMDVGSTTRLTAFWGIGVLISMLLSGLFLLKWLGFMRLMRIGMIASAGVFAGVIIVGLAGNPGIFKGLVFVMGLATGLAGAGMLSGVISFTTTIRAGLLMGVWGMGNLLGKAIGSLFGGIVIDLMRLEFGSPFLAYAALFSIEVILLIVAFFLTTRLDIKSSKAEQEAAFAAA